MLYNEVHAGKFEINQAGHCGTLFRSREAFALLQESIEKKDPVSGRCVQALLEKYNLSHEAFWGDHLIRLYASCGKLQEADLAFYKVKKPSIHTWSAIIAAQVNASQNVRGLELFFDMVYAGLQPSEIIFLYAFKACKNLGCTFYAKLVHDRIIRFGMQSQTIIANALIDAYAKCGNLSEAQNVFHGTPNRDVVSWCSLIAGYAAHGKGLEAFHVFEKMQQERTALDKVVFISVLKACGSMNTANKIRMIHQQVTHSGYESDLYIGSSLVDVYARSGCLQEAHAIFDKLKNRNAVSWAMLIVAYAEHGGAQLAMELLEKMQQEKMDTDKFALISIIKACGSVGSLRHGRLLHNKMQEDELLPDKLLSNACIDMYSKCGSLEDANDVFEKLPNHDVISWGAMIAGYDGNGSKHMALNLFEKMQHAGVMVNVAVFLPVLNVCSCLDYLEHGMLIHGQLIERNEDMVLVVANKLVDMYAKTGKVEEAHRVFHAMPHRDRVSWATIILGCAEHGHGSSALDLFQKMWQECSNADKAIFLCALKACGGTGAIKLAKLIHHQVMMSCLHKDLDIGNTLVDVYAKVGSLDDACRAFDQLPARDKVSWSAMISGYARCSSFEEAGRCLGEMQRHGLQLHDGIFLSLLVACTHAGVLAEGYRFFNLMINKFGITPIVQHYHCIIDLLGRVGQLKEAIAILTTMPATSDMMVWTSLLTSCKVYRDVDLGRVCFNEVSKGDPDDASGYLLMCSIYADAEMWHEVDKLRAMRKFVGAQKKRGVTWVEANNMVHEFVVGDECSGLNDIIILKAERIHKLMKESMYLPLLDLVVDPNHTET